MKDLMYDFYVLDFDTTKMNALLLPHKIYIKSKLNHIWNIEFDEDISDLFEGIVITPHIVACEISV